MKKVIALFIACLVCIVGTAVGVAISASHLSEKDLLSARDVQLALASQGTFSHRLPSGEFTELAVHKTPPVLYKADGVTLVVYAFPHAIMEENTSILSAWADNASYQIMPASIWRNLWVGYLLPVQAQGLSDSQLSPQEESAFIEVLQRTNVKIMRMYNHLVELFNDFQVQTFQIETKQMRYTIEQRSCYRPIAVEGQSLYECWTAFRPLDCQYKEPPPATELPVTFYFEAVTSGSKVTYTNEQRSWDGQGQFAYLIPLYYVRSVTDTPQSIHYRMLFDHGMLHDDGTITVDWEK